MHNQTPDRNSCLPSPPSKVSSSASPVELSQQLILKCFLFGIFKFIENIFIVLCLQFLAQNSDYPCNFLSDKNPRSNNVLIFGL